jgi:hypothetical protein
MATLEGKYAYQSFTSCMGTMGAVPIPPEILSPWTPHGELQATTDPAGKVTGTL